MKCTVILSLACFFFLPLATIAQKHHGVYGVSKGDVYISPSIGIERIGRYSESAPAVWKNYGTDLKMPLVTASLDLALTDYITIAPYAGYAITGETGPAYFGGPNYDYRCKHVLIGSKNAYHFRLGSGRVEGYAGITLGLHLAKETLAYISQSGVPQKETNKESRFFYNIFVGSKLYFTKQVALFGEVGYGITWLNLGVACKLN